MPDSDGKKRPEGKSVSERSLTPVPNDGPARRSNSGTVGTVLGEDSIFQGGKIISKGTLRIDGTVEGEIVAEESVVVGPTGLVKANIKARSVAVSGKVHGNIEALERLELQPTSEVCGDVVTAAGALIIEGGAKLEGKCIMGMPEGSPRPLPAEATPRPKAPEKGAKPAEQAS